MPRRKIAPQPRPSCQVGTLDDIADTFGTHRNTASEWGKAGAPAPYLDKAKKPVGYSLVEWFVWALMPKPQFPNGYKLALPQEPLTRALCQFVLDRTGLIDAPVATGDLPGVCSYDRLIVNRKGWDYTIAQMREKVIGEELANGMRRKEALKLDRDLVTRADAEGAAAKVFDAFRLEGEQLGNSVLEQLTAAGITLPTDTQAKITAAVDHAWADVLERAGKVKARA